MVNVVVGLNPVIDTIGLIVPSPPFNPDKPGFPVQGSKFEVQGLRNPKLGTVNREHGTLLIKASHVGINIFCHKKREFSC